MSLRVLTGVAIAVALVSTPAFACKGRTTAFSDDFAREDPSWTTIFNRYPTGRTASCAFGVIRIPA